MKYIDLFAGVGGFHQAMSSLKSECVFASEWDQDANQTYYENYRILPAGDITQIKEDEIPEHDMLCAGFPCQAFSISGKQNGFADTRGTLFFEIVRIVKKHTPRVLLLENVRNFEKHDHGKTLQTVVLTLEKIGYRVFYQVLNASDFGLPQNRERIFFVCFRNNLQIKTFHFPQPCGRMTCLVDILEKTPIDAKIVNRNDTVFTKSFEPQVNFFGELELPNRPIQIGYVNKGGQGERIYSPYGHAVTLSAYGGGVGAKTGLYLINGVIRKLTPRECARVQGFPDSFKIISSSSKAYTQFGNSVAINVVRSVVEKIYQTNCFSDITTDSFPSPAQKSSIPSKEECL